MADGEATIATLIWVMSALVADGIEYGRPSKLSNRAHDVGGADESTEPARPVKRAPSKDERRPGQSLPLPSARVVALHHRRNPQRT